ncbi:MAG: DNA polymerase III subunit gamma/tau [Patescibacteria group bacterium]
MPSLSRTYRPKNFADITGQDRIKETLRKEVETGILGHAYLFSGPRGIGKTTMARVFAKALNCLESKNGEPCNKCTACVEQNNGNAMDVIEMDAASNTGVDNIREAIIEHVRFTPHSRKFKVYILDEAHMLSTSAWNALLKTLEEPPAYAMFILVTTELHKVPATIQSRCQRFDFRRIPDQALRERIEQIALNEGLKLEPSVIATIVSKSDGCLRDGESLLGQLIALGEKNITTEIAGLVLPESRLPVAASLLEIWSKRQLGKSLDAVKETEEQGIPLMTVFDDLIQAARLLLVAADSDDFLSKLLSGDEGEKKIASLVNIFKPAELADMALLFMERRRDAKQGADTRFCLELSAATVCLGILPNGPGKAAEIAQTTSHDENSNKNVSDISLNKIESQKESQKIEKENPSAQISESTFSLNDVRSKWQTFLKILDEKSRSLTFILKLCRPLEVRENVVVLGFKYPYHREKIVEEIKSKRLVEDCLREAVNSNNLHIEGIIDNQEIAEEKPADMVGKILKAFEGQVVEEKGNI